MTVREEDGKLIILLESKDDRVIGTLVQTDISGLTSQDGETEIDFHQIYKGTTYFPGLILKKVEGKKFLGLSSSKSIKGEIDSIVFES